jgi:hypothetical protein
MYLLKAHSDFYGTILNVLLRSGATGESSEGVNHATRKASTNI